MGKPRLLCLRESFPHASPLSSAHTPRSCLHCCWPLSLQFVPMSSVSLFSVAALMEYSKCLVGTRLYHLQFALS